MKKIKTLEELVQYVLFCDGAGRIEIGIIEGADIAEDLEPKLLERVRKMLRK